MKDITNACMLTDEQKRRYSRNISLPSLGLDGQRKLLSSKALIVGCGALGSIAAMYLAASGVGHISIVDFDTVGLSNLQRQLSYTVGVIGEKKVFSLARRLHEINPDIEVVTHDRVITMQNAEEIIADADIVIEGSDNPATKHMLASVCQRIGIPCIVGGVREWEGQITCSMPGSEGYLDLFPEPADACGLMPCSAGGVLGPLPGIVASMQAAETIKILAGAGTPLSSRILIYDALKATVRVIEF